MTLAQTDRGIASLLAGLGDLHLDRTDISFHNIDADRVRVSVTIRNRGPGRSRPTEVVLRSAPLGAFVAWTPLTTIDLPALSSGETIEVSVVVPRPAAAPRGFFDDNPPRMRTAVGAGDQGRRRLGQRLASITQTVLEMLMPQTRRSAADSALSESTDLSHLLLDTNPHWAGNINVLVANTDVERHMAQAIRIYRGRSNIVAFFVGDERPDEYKFELKGPGSDWDAVLYKSRDLKTVLQRPEWKMQQSQWISVARTLPIVLIFQPPEDCDATELAVHVTRRRTGQTAIVEFSLDPSAAGPGCYAV